MMRKTNVNGAEGNSPALKNNSEDNSTAKPVQTVAQAGSSNQRRFVKPAVVVNVNKVPVINATKINLRIKPENPTFYSINDPAYRYVGQKIPNLFTEARVARLLMQTTSVKACYQNVVSSEIQLNTHNVQQFLQQNVAAPKIVFESIYKVSNSWGLFDVLNLNAFTQSADYFQFIGKFNIYDFERLLEGIDRDRQVWSFDFRNCSVHHPTDPRMARGRLRTMINYFPTKHLDELCYDSCGTDNDYFIETVATLWEQNIKVNKLRIIAGGFCTTKALFYALIVSSIKM